MTTEPRMIVREADPADADELTRLAHRSKAHWGYPPAWIAQWQEDLTLTAEYIRDHQAWVAKISGRIVGTCVLERQTNTWSLEHVWVDPDVMKRGVGRTLVRRALDAAAATEPLDVDVLSDPYAEPFYLRLGARRVGASPAPMPGAPDRALPRLQFDAGYTL